MPVLCRVRRGFLVKLIVTIPTLYILAVLIFSTDNNWKIASVEDKRVDKPLFQGGLSLDSANSGHQSREVRLMERARSVSEPLVLAGDGGLPQRKDVDIGGSLGGAKTTEKKHVDSWNRPNEQGVEQTLLQDKDAPGESGRAVTVDKSKLSEEDKRRWDLGWKNNAYNQFVSDMISLHRSLPDVRDRECMHQSYPNNLPATSVVICFHNEAWSVLLRTVHSVLDRTPPHLLREIILVDDYSDMDHLKKPLEDYLGRLDKVRLTRTKERQGLIRARLAGFSLTTADVVTFLDSHCECTPGWVEPLLDRIAANESHVVCPVIDVIDDNTLKYQFSNAKSTSIGGFDWNLQFSWHAIPEYERRRRKSNISPVRSPTMAGGLFAISRRYFEKLGTYDAAMDIWGGENLELSFRVWMCGGSLEIIPCSHVGHIFRKRSPYKWRAGVNVVKKNTVRLAEVWMDDYKNYYYERFNYDLGEYGDVTARRELRSRLQCKSFDWYVKHIYPDLFIPGLSAASGEIRSLARPMCVDSPADHHNYHKPVNMWPCHNQGGNQYWMLSKNGEIRRDDGCLDYSGGENVIIYPCHGQKGNQEWKYQDDNTLHHINTHKCAEVSGDGKNLTMRACSGIDRQVWLWKRKPAGSGPGNST